MFSIEKKTISGKILRQYGKRSISEETKSLKKIDGAVDEWSIIAEALVSFHWKILCFIGLGWLDQLPEVQDAASISTQ